MNRQRRVILESPYRGDIARNKKYLQRAIRDSCALGESPYASHQMLTDALDDSNIEERTRGIEAGYLWWHVADAIVVYEDYGFSEGMQRAIQRALSLNLVVESRRIGRNPDDPISDGTDSGGEETTDPGDSDVSGR